MNIKDYETILSAVRRAIDEKLKEHTPETYDDSTVVAIIEELQDDLVAEKAKNKALTDQFSEFKASVGEMIKSAVDGLQTRDQVVEAVKEAMPEPIKGDPGEDATAPTVEELHDYLAKREDFGSRLAVTCRNIIEDMKYDLTGAKGEDAKFDHSAVYTRVDETVKKLLPDMMPDPESVDMTEVEAIIKEHMPTVPEVVHGKDGADAPPPSDLQVREAVKSIYNDIRDDILPTVKMVEHVGPHEEGEEYESGKEVSKNGSTYRARVNTRQAPPGEDWNVVSKSKMGKPGRQGDAGEKGEPGRDAPRIVGGTYIDGEKMFLQLDTGDVVEIDIEKPEGTEDGLAT